MSCPQCDRELLPAYVGPEGLEVGYWDDFDPGLVRHGLMVCGDFNCDYQEPVEFATDSADAVVVNLDQTLMIFQEENSPSMPYALAREIADEIAVVRAATGRAKLRCAENYYRAIEESRIERIATWIEAAGELPVCFRCESGEVEGHIVQSEGDAILIETAEGDLITVPKGDITWERIEYPLRHRRERVEGEPIFVIPLVNRFYIVVEGYHLHFGDAKGPNTFTASIEDPAIAQALRMERKAERYYQGIFHRDEIQRYYWRRDRLKILGHWVEEHGWSQDESAVYIETADPAVAKELNLEPRYALVHMEFGCSDGDVVAYYGSFPGSAVEDRSWYEEIHELDEEEVEDFLWDE